MTESESLEYLEELGKTGIVPGLDRIREFLRRLGNPQDQLRFVHFAGTNGKGSTLSYVGSALECAGLQVGYYTSPAVVHPREIIRVGKRKITKDAICRGMERIRECNEAMKAEGSGSVSRFEAETALAFLYFLEAGCDMVMLECGMGGEQDATNVITAPQVSVITSISYDHMKFLGNTLGEIAAQKAGIMRPGIPTVTCAQDPEAMAVLRQRAESLGAPLVVADVSEAKNVKYGLQKQRFSYGFYKNLEISVPGAVQITNAVLAVAVLATLQIPENAIRKGLLQMTWPGRFTVIGKKPLFIVDGAHNEDAALQLAKSLDLYFTNKRILFIMGILKDKEVRRIAEITAPYADQIFTVKTPDNPRAMDALELARVVAEFNPRVTATDSVEEAAELVKLMAAPEDVIVAFGSLSFLGILMKDAEKKKATGKKV